MSIPVDPKPLLPASVSKALDLPVSLLPDLLAITRAVSTELLEHYNNAEAISVEQKADRSPITAADRAAHDRFQSGLARLTPHIPLLSEESQAAEIAERRDWPACWMVDPLDGTKEFIGRTGEFTSNVALVWRRRPVLGLIAVPVENRCYLGIPGVGAWRYSGGDWQACEVLGGSDDDRGVDTPLRLLASQRHDSRKVNALISALSGDGATVERINAGSALKFCALVEGTADIYPRTSPCYEWDVAAGDALVHGAGGFVLGADDQPLQYNARPGLLVDYFVAGTGPARDCVALLG